MNNRGFTLVELIVVMALIVFITGLTIVSLRPGQEELLLERSIHKLAQDSRSALGFSLRAKPHGCGGNFGGYGIYFEEDSTTYVLFEDCNETLKYEPSDDEGEEFKFEDGVRIQSATPLQAGKLHIVFAPPDPDVYINTNLSVMIQAEIVIELTNDPSRTRTLIITGRGLIDIE